MYGIDSIGNNPYMNGLGTLGLGGMSSFGSFGDYSLNGGLGTSGLNGYGSFGFSPYAAGGMMGMYNPAFMGQFVQAQQNIEKANLQHATDMHSLLLKNNVENFNAQDRALFEKAMCDAAVNKGIRNLSQKIKEGDQDGICQEFDALKQTIYTKYADYFKENCYKMNPNDSVTNWIEILYSQIVSKQENKIVDLTSDIKKYGQTPFEHGFWKNLHGKDYHDKYTEETLSYIYNTNIDNKAGKDRMEGFGVWTERITEAGMAGLLGMGLGALAKHKKLGAAMALAGDIIWQLSR